jgi:hypothetical protein
MSIILHRFLSGVHKCCWATYLWVHIMIHGLLMGAEATMRVELDEMVDQ